MSDRFIAILAALIVAIPAVGALIVSLATLWMQAQTGAKVTDIHVQINSRMDKLLELAHAAGVVEGKGVANVPPSV